MKFPESEKKNIIGSAKSVYNGYLAIDFFKSREFCKLTEKAPKAVTLQQLCNDAINANELNKTFFCNGTAYTLELTKKEDFHYSMQISLTSPQIPTLAFKKRIKDYSDDEAMALISKQRMEIQSEYLGRYDVVSNTLTNDKRNITIGGKNCIDLYRTHLVTLHNIIVKISSGDDISSLLVALATGSGKTYVQGLWMLSLYLSGNSAFFGVPDKLVVQFKKDLARLLPEDFLDTMKVLRQNDSLSSPDIIQALDDLGKADAEAAIIIGSSEELLDKHYQRLLKANTEKTFLSFDEQHLLMRREIRRVRLIELSKRFLSMYLTATPSNETYMLAGQQPVAIMSSGQKQDAGQGQFPVIFEENAKNISDRNALKSYKFWTGDFWASLLNSLELRFFNAFQHEQSSSAVSIIENLPFYVHRKPDEVDVRWSMQVPMAHKMLWIIDDNETLVNVCQALQKDKPDMDVYHNGNMVNRKVIAQFFNIDDIDADIFKKDFSQKQADYRAMLSPNEVDIGGGLAQHSLASQLANNIQHNMMEYVLCDLTGLDEIEHNRLRKKNPEAFQELIRYRFMPRDAEYYKEKLQNQIDLQGAEQIGAMLADLSTILGSYRGNSDKDDFNQFVDNWHLNGTVNAYICGNYQTNFSERFTSYLKNHVMFGLMTGMNKAETPVDDINVFSGMTRKSYDLFDKDGMPVKNAKKRSLSVLERLNDTSEETVFTPNYMEGITEQQADNYFRLGFIGIYVSNRKTEGFSDTHLHTVINFSDTQTASTNSPESLIQGIGRNRGLDETVVPTYIFAMGRKVRSYFNLDNLKKDDYYPDLFKSQKIYNKDFMTTLGQNVAKDIIVQYDSLVEPDETIDAAQFRHVILKRVTQALRNLNDNNGHDIQLSRKQLATVVGVAMTTLNQEIQRIKNPSNFSIFMRTVDFLLNGVSELYYMPKRAKTAWKLYQLSWFGNKTQDGGTQFLSQYDTLYVKIIQKTSYKKLVEKLTIGSKFKSWMERKKAAIKRTLEVNTDEYLDASTLAEVKNYQDILIAPLFAKFVKEGKKELVRKQVKAMPNILPLLDKHQATLKEINTVFDKEKVLAILHEVNGLESLTTDDLENYQEKIEGILASFKKGPLIFVQENPLVKEKLKKDWAIYLKGAFLEAASHLLLDKDWQQLNTYLQKEKQAEDFLEHLLNKQGLGLQQMKVDILFQEFKNFSKLEDFASPDQRIKASLSGLSEEVKQLDDNIFAVFSDLKIEQMALVIKQLLLPSLVNYFPLEKRGAMLLSADLPKIKALIKEQGMAFKKALLTNDTDFSSIVTTIFAKLYDEPLPQIIPVDEQIATAQKFVQAKLDAIKNQSKWSVLRGKLQSVEGVSSLIKNKYYVFDKPIKELLQSDDFLKAISLLLPYDQWLECKNLIKNDKNDCVVQLARGLIDYFGSSVDKTPTSDELLELINTHLQKKFTSSVLCATSAKESLKLILEGVKKNPVNALDKTLVTKIATAVRESLLPTLMLFITDKALKQKMLGEFEAKSDFDLCDFCLKNQENFDELLSNSAGNKENLAVQLINTLLPEIEAIKRTQITCLSTEMKSIQNGFLLTSIVSYLTSDNFFDFAALLFNEADFNALKTYLQQANNAQKVAEVLVKNPILTDPMRVFELLKETSQLQIKPLNDHITGFSRLIQRIENAPVTYLDKEKFSTLLTNGLTPILFHKDFYSSIDSIMGYLNEGDIHQMLMAIDSQNASLDLAKLIIRFLKVIKKGDKEALQKEFFNLDNATTLDLDGVLAKKVMDKIADIADEIITCHSYYNNHDKKGTVYGANMKLGALVSKISPCIENIQVEITESYFSGLSRKVFFIHALGKALPTSFKIESESYAAKVRALDKVYAQVLRPIWWGLTFPNLGPKLVKLGHAIRDAFKTVYFYIANFVQKILSLAGKDKVKRINAGHLDATLDYTTTINALKRLDDKSVVRADCLPDSITTVEVQHNLYAKVPMATTEKNDKEETKTTLNSP